MFSLSYAVRTSGRCARWALKWSQNLCRLHLPQFVNQFVAFKVHLVGGTYEARFDFRGGFKHGIDDRRTALENLTGRGRETPSRRQRVFFARDALHGGRASRAP